jgi:hypothetical protein
VANMANLDEQANRLKALWKSGRDKYASFFAVLNEVHAEIGDDELFHWCFDNLHIGMSVILKTRKVLAETDEKAVRTNLKHIESDAKKFERAKARIAELEAQLAARVPDTAAAERIRELEAQVATLTAAKSEASSSKAPQRDRRDYMREFMRRKRAATKAS